jgi:hypothetical protein
LLPPQGEALGHRSNRRVPEARAELLQMMNTSSFAKTTIGRQVPADVLE